MSNILVLPISGGAFPAQLGILCDLCDAKYKPDLTLASSGGNIAAYTALAADWCQYGIQRIARQYDSRMFIQSWWPSTLEFLPSVAIGFFKGSTYNASDVCQSLFADIFTPITIRASEIITGTIHADTGRFRIFCNKSRMDSFIGNTTKCQFAQSLEPIFLDGDVKRIALATVASASIPTLVPECTIDDEKYTDGGGVCASPLSALKFTISKLTSGGISFPTETKISSTEPVTKSYVISASASECHITYVSSFNMASNPKGVPRTGGTMLSKGKVAISDLIANLCIADRLVGIEIIAMLMVDELHYREGPCDTTMMKKLSICRQQSKRSMIEYYPNSDSRVAVDNFDGAAVLAVLETVRRGYSYRVWWIGDPLLFSRE